MAFIMQNKTDNGLGTSAPVVGGTTVIVDGTFGNTASAKFTIEGTSAVSACEFAQTSASFVVNGPGTLNAELVGVEAGDGTNVTIETVAP